MGRCRRCGGVPVGRVPSTHVSVSVSVSVAVAVAVRMAVAMTVMT